MRLAQAGRGSAWQGKARLGTARQGHTTRSLGAAPADASTSEIAAGVLASARKADLLPLVVAEVEHRRRTLTRNIERAVIKKRLGAMVTDRDRDRMEAARTAVSKDHLLALLRRKWALGDGTMVEVGRATLPEIRQRLDLMRRQRAGLDESIRVLEAIEAELERTGARCLDDLMKTQGVAA